LAQIRAAIEIGRRLTEEGFSEDRPKVVSAKDVATMLGPRLRDLKKEVFKAVLLNPQNRVIDTQEITCGTVDQAFPISREIFHAAIEKFAAALICVHNHPSGNCRPSLEDKFFTTELVNAGKTLNIRVLDHIIIAGDGYFSFKDEGLI
jgi:DNA repair protein RadC